jgi:ArsR family transcriptional regulator, arsenate/arsenite/antimonite-responsive transcriptional repressor
LFFPLINRTFAMNNNKRRAGMKRTLSAVEYSGEEEIMASIAKAISHPVRIKILKLLASQQCCFTGELTELIPMAQSTISQHLKALLEAGLIQGEINPPKVRYCINRDTWLTASTLLGGFFNADLTCRCECR